MNNRLVQAPLCACGAEVAKVGEICHRAALADQEQLILKLQEEVRVLSAARSLLSESLKYQLEAQEEPSSESRVA